MSTSDRLYALLLGTWTPKRASRMTGLSTQDGKYKDILEYSFTGAHLIEHLAGRETYAITLGLLGEARAGAKDYDDASEAEILAALRIAADKGITAAAFLVGGRADQHRGGHLWTFYDALYSIADILAQLRTIPRSGKGEDFPSNQPVRIPFGYHKIKRTRGVLVLQDGRRFDLDTPEGLEAGLVAFLALPLNGKPEPAPLGEDRTSGQAWGEHYKAENWKDLPDGGRLWRSAYIAAAAERRLDLAKLLRGERVTLTKKDDTRDDSDSAQVAALAYNLLSADVCEVQARAIADYLKPQLRPGRTLEHYRAHFDAELERYTPTHYKPQVIRYLGPADGDEPPELPPAQYKPERKSRARKDRPQRVAGHLGYLAWLRTQAGDDGVVLLSQRECAKRLGCCLRTIKRYEDALGDQIERDPYAGRQCGRLFLRGDNIISEAIDLMAEDVVIAETEIPQQYAEKAVPVSMQEEHPAPLASALADLAAWWEAQPPVSAEDWGSPAERQALADELLAVGNVGAAWWIVGSSPPSAESKVNAPSLLGLVREAFDVLAIGGARLSFSRVRRYVEANARRELHPAAIARHYERERGQRQRTRSWQRQIASLATMKIGRLNALDKRAQAILADGPTAKTYRWASAIYPHIAAELERRADIRDRLRLDQRRRTIDQALLFAEVEDQIAEHRASCRWRKGPIAQAARPPGIYGGASVLPLPAAAPIDPMATIARLKAQRDARQAIGEA
jgi:hypothetical protein